MKEIKKAFIRANYLTRLIYINLIVFTIIKFLNVFAFLMQKDTFDIILFLGLPADISNLIVKPWTIITYMFTHESFIHLLFNLLWLYFGGKIFLKYLNYKQLISFFEGAIHKSIKEGSADYNALHMSCIQCIRHLDNLISSYDQTVLGAKLVNQTIDKIINENTPLNPSTKKDVGNDQS